MCLGLVCHLRHLSQRWARALALRQVCLVEMEVWVWRSLQQMMLLLPALPPLPLLSPPSPPPLLLLHQ